MKRVGPAILVLSAIGFPLTEMVIRRWGRGGAIVTEAVCIGLLVRDAAMIGSGAPARLRKGPAVLLWCEMTAAATAVAAGLPLALGTQRARAMETGRRVAVGALFGLHTARFAIYLQPDRGLRHTA